MQGSCRLGQKTVKIGMHLCLFLAHRFPRLLCVYLYLAGCVAADCQSDGKKSLATLVLDQHNYWQNSRTDDVAVK